MTALTAPQLDAIANASLEYFVRGPAMSSVIQKKPLMEGLRKKQKTFPGGKENISVPVKGQYTTSLTGYTHTDTVNYSEPFNLLRASYPWKELHAGIKVSHTELKMDGITVSDSAHSAETNDVSDVALIRLAGLLEDKLEDMAEGWAQSFNSMLWADGVSEPLEVPGITSIIVDDPTLGTLGGISRVTNDWWRNRAVLGTTPDEGSSALINVMRAEFRQLRRYGGNPDLILAGSDFLDALEKEIFAKGNITDTGFKAKKSTDFAMAEISFKGRTFMYDPTLDDLSKEKYCYVLDTKHTYLDVMEGEDNKIHTPARPNDEYVMYRAMTWTGGLVCDQPNTTGVYSIA